MTSISRFVRRLRRAASPFADFVCYFFEKARSEIAADSSTRAGLLATNSIRGGVNRESWTGSRRQGTSSWRGRMSPGY